jgi:Rieske Fe-S protein
VIMRSNQPERHRPPVDTAPPIEASRREVLRTAGVAGVVLAAGATLAACGGSGGSNGSAAKADSGSAGATVPVGDVPVGGGTILQAQRIVVTQPEKGTFKAFSAVCTHMGCTVGNVSNGTITCPCHGSQYSAADGSVTRGPASRSLAAKTVTEKGDQLVVS